VGGTETISVDVRLVTATNRNLEEAVRAGTFREDLYYRLNVIPIFLPSLRERPEDIPPLIEHFLARFNRENAKNVRISRNVYETLLRYPWPGNIRELQHAIEHAVVMAAGSEASDTDLPLSVLNSYPGSGVVPAGNGSAGAPGPSHDNDSPLSTIERSEKSFIVDALEKCGWVQSKAARALGITPRQIGYKIRKYGIVSPRA
jgi:Nif-specific regulatory protein